MQIFEQKKIKQNVYILCTYSIKRDFSILGYSSYGHLMVILWFGSDKGV